MVIGAWSTPLRWTLDSHYHQDGDMASFLTQMFRDGLFDTSKLNYSTCERESLQLLQAIMYTGGITWVHV